MIGRIIEHLGADEQVLRIARKLTQVEMWVSEHQMRWFLIKLDDIIDRIERLRRAA